VREEEGVAVVLGHALYMRAIHGGKAKNDPIDAEKIARLLRGGNLPVAYVYPKAMRATRDLLRRRTFLVRKRAELLAHLVNTNSQYNLPPLTKKLAYAANRPHPPGAGPASPLPRRQRPPQRRGRPRPDPRLRRADPLPGAVPEPGREGGRPAGLPPLAVGARGRQGAGAGAALRDPRHPPLPLGRPVPLLRPPGALRPRVGRQEEGQRRQQDRQRPPQVGRRRGHLPAPAGERAGHAVPGGRGEEAGQGGGPGRSGGAAGPGGLPPAAPPGGL